MAEGRTWYDTDTELEYIHDGAAWKRRDWEKPWGILATGTRGAWGPLQGHADGRASVITNTTAFELVEGRMLRFSTQLKFTWNCSTRVVLSLTDYDSGEAPEYYNANFHRMTEIQRGSGTTQIIVNASVIVPTSTINADYYGGWNYGESKTVSITAGHVDFSSSSHYITLLATSDFVNRITVEDIGPS